MLEGAENGQGQFASTSTDNTGTITVSDNNLSIAQQALAAFEAGGGLHSADFGMFLWSVTLMYVTIIVK